mmetsp:Transcript_17386/g.32742  ORF Transcript_17386/g.32742 Transcript_17386/m.32742 type:complete len:204 (-) Transcript_17386:69-680(-)
MPFDFYDIDEILSEDFLVSCKPVNDIKGGGILDTTAGASSQDLAKGTKVQLPFCLAQALMRRRAITLDMPGIFGQTVQEDLTRDAIVVRVCDKTPYYFEIGYRLASLTQDVKLESCLSEAVNARWREMLNLLGRMGVAPLHYSQLNPGSSIFPQTLTEAERHLLLGGKEAEKNFKKWMDKYNVTQIEASTIVEAPVKRLRTGL